jgi:hypothetical protein
MYAVIGANEENTGTDRNQLFFKVVVFRCKHSMRLSGKRDAAEMLKQITKNTAQERQM